MKIKSLVLTLLGLWLVLPAAAAACDTYLGYLPWVRPSGQIGIGAGLQVQPGEDGGPTYWIPNVEGSIAAGDKAIVKGALGYCTSTGGPSGFSSDSYVTFGGGGALQVVSSGNLAVNVQAAVTAYSYDGGSEQVIPLTANAVFGTGGMASFFGMAGLQLSRASFDSGFGSGSATDTDPVLGAGVLLRNIVLGLTLKIGEDGLGGTSTDLAINGSFQFSLPG